MKKQSKFDRCMFALNKPGVLFVVGFLACYLTGPLYGLVIALAFALTHAVILDRIRKRVFTEFIMDTIRKETKP